ncbi:hypothetical protein E3J79_01970 [Candidatus Dependentiae bacterium]|nr:MAG: hypothetical protein E3J79_01970 [Candidatus Dependentiae bacterium]
MTLLLKYGIKKIVQTVLFYGGLKLAALLKLSYLVGSHTIFFSATNLMYPLGGCFLGLSGSFLWFVLSFCIRLLSGAPIFLHLVHGVPGFCAALYMGSSHILIRLVLPIVCMVFFVLHPIGFQVAPYSFYWLIPVVLYFLKRKSFFLEALGATFIAHAVGSVFWLYLVPMPTVYWWALMPVVAVERLFFATGVVLVYSSCIYCWRIIKKITQKKAQPSYQQCV